jgi:ABC-type glycerol-3-phosphate transport system substrate-binding protein
VSPGDPTWVTCADAVSADLNVKVLTALASGDPPDLFSMRRAEMPSFVTKDALLPLDELRKRANIALDNLVDMSEVHLSIDE